MKIACKIGIHKWHYYEQLLHIDSDLPTIKSQIIKNAPVRICKNCMLKQYKLNLWNTYLNYNLFNSNKWEKFEIYTKDEKREIKLRTILNDL